MSFDIDAIPSVESQARSSSLRNGFGPHRARRSVLFVTPFLPSPPMFGAQRRLHELISGVAASSETSVVSLVDPREDQGSAVKATEEYCRRVVTVSNPAYHSGRALKRLRQLASLGSSHSYDWRGRREALFAAALEHMLLSRYDVVHFELAPMAGYAATRRVGSGPRPVLCLDEHNIEYDIVRRTARLEAGGLRRMYSAIEWRKVRNEERRAWRLLDGCTVTSVRDRDLLLSHEPTARTAVVANGVDLEFFHQAAASDARAAPSLLFFGAMDYHPNADAVLHFVRDILPRLTAARTTVRVSIVGRQPPESVRALQSDNVEVTGVVEDVRPWLERADVVIVPLRIGGGTRLKILEAMAMGKAVVSTTLGAEGLDLVPGRDVLLADDAASFAAQVVRLLAAPEERRRLGAAARRLVEGRYSWKRSVESLSAFYDELLETRAACA
jgi:glycosyltransferase involved in cell wall biosynthesis